MSLKYATILEHQYDSPTYLIHQKHGMPHHPDNAAVVWYNLYAILAYVELLYYTNGKLQHSSREIIL